MLSRIPHTGRIRSHTRWNVVAAAETEPGSPAANPASSAAAQPTAGNSLYALLRLNPNASSTELRQAFRSLSKRYHPDTTTLPAAEAEEQFRRLQLAYATLSDPERRRRYDAELQRASALAALRPLKPSPVFQAPAPVRRALSGGEWFALLLLALALVFSLVLGLGLAWARGTALVMPPSWWPVETSGQTAQAPAVAPADGLPASPPDAALQPPVAQP